MTLAVELVNALAEALKYFFFGETNHNDPKVPEDERSDKAFGIGKMFTIDDEVVPGLVEVEVAVPRSRPAVW
jgi:hypothetical protein